MYFAKILLHHSKYASTSQDIIIISLLFQAEAHRKHTQTLKKKRKER